MVKESRIQITVSGKQVPALAFENSQRSRGTVLVYHGLSAGKEIQRKEAMWLAQAGFVAIVIDAPHHGERRDDYLEKLVSADAHETHFLVMKLIYDAIQEIPEIVEFCQANFSANVGITGISLGGYIAYGAVVCEPRLKASVPILGSPDWKPKQDVASSHMLELEQNAPVHFAGSFFPCALFASNASRDIYVPSRHSRNFIETLQPEYRSQPHRLKYVEYTESEHMMREEDWNDLWRQAVAWFEEYL